LAHDTRSRCSTIGLLVHRSELPIPALDSRFILLKKYLILQSSHRVDVRHLRVVYVLHVSRSGCKITTASPVGEFM
jgi:hypothetical protein